MKYIRKFVSLIITISIVVFLVWGGFKAGIGFLLGNTVMAYLLLSENPLLIYVLDMLGLKED